MKLASTGDYLGMYHVQLDGIKSGGVSLAAGDSVIVDTGATHLVLPEEVGQRPMVPSLDADRSSFPPSTPRFKDGELRPEPSSSPVPSVKVSKISCLPSVGKIGLSITKISCELCRL